MYLFVIAKIILKPVLKRILKLKNTQILFTSNVKYLMKTY